MNVFANAVSVLTLAGGLAGVVSLFYVRPTRRKLVNEAQKAGAEASQIVAAGATILLQPLQSRVQELEDETHRLREKLVQADREASELRVALERERETSREEREVSQEVIRTLKLQLLERDQLIKKYQGARTNHSGGDHDTR